MDKSKRNHKYLDVYIDIINRFVKKNAILK